MNFLVITILILKCLICECEQIIKSDILNMNPRENKLNQHKIENQLSQDSRKINSKLEGNNALSNVIKVKNYNIDKQNSILSSENITKISKDTLDKLTNRKKSQNIDLEQNSTNNLNSNGEQKVFQKSSKMDLEITEGKAKGSDSLTKNSEGLTVEKSSSYFEHDITNNRKLNYSNIKNSKNLNPENTKYLIKHDLIRNQDSNTIKSKIKNIENVNNVNNYQYKDSIVKEHGDLTKNSRNVTVEKSLKEKQLNDLKEDEQGSINNRIKTNNMNLKANNNMKNPDSNVNQNSQQKFGEENNIKSVIDRNGNKLNDETTKTDVSKLKTQDKKLEDNGLTKLNPESNKIMKNPDSIVNKNSQQKFGKENKLNDETTKTDVSKLKTQDKKLEDDGLTKLNPESNKIMKNPDSIVNKNSQQKFGEENNVKSIIDRNGNKLNDETTKTDVSKLKTQDKKLEDNNLTNTTAIKINNQPEHIQVKGYKNNTYTNNESITNEVDKDILEKSKLQVSDKKLKYGLKDNLDKVSIGKNVAKQKDKSEINEVTSNKIPSLDNQNIQQSNFQKNKDARTNDISNSTITKLDSNGMDIKKTKSFSKNKSKNHEDNKLRDFDEYKNEKIDLKENKKSEENKDYDGNDNDEKEQSFKKINYANDNSNNIRPPLSTNKKFDNKRFLQTPHSEMKTSYNFIVLLVFGLLFAILLYVVFNSKKKILGLIFEGRPRPTSRNGRQSSSDSHVSYKPLATQDLEKQSPDFKYVY